LRPGPDPADRQLPRDAERFWMITTNHTVSGSHNFFVTAENPEGP